MADQRAWGRIRVREEQAHLLHRLLWEERGRITSERARWRQIAPALTNFNQIIAVLDSTKAELGRLADEQGWVLDDQSWGEVPQGADLPEAG